MKRATVPEFGVQPDLAAVERHSLLTDVESKAASWQSGRAGSVKDVEYRRLVLGLDTGTVVRKAPNVSPAANADL